MHRRSQVSVGGGAPGRRHAAMHQWRTPLKFSRATVDLGRAPAVNRVMGGAPERKKIAKKMTWNDIWGRVFVNAVSLKYIGMI